MGADTRSGLRFATLDPHLAKVFDLLTTLHDSDPETTKALALVAVERALQIAKGYTPSHDDGHDVEELVAAAAVYAIGAAPEPFSSALGLDSDIAFARARLGLLWPWERESYTPGTPSEDLIRAGALIVAALARLFRTSAGQSPASRAPESQEDAEP